MSKITNEIVRLLNVHGIPWRERGEIIEVCDHYTIGGEPRSRWVNLPGSIPEVLRWLGY